MVGTPIIPVVVPMLAELFGSEEPSQEEPLWEAPLPTASLPLLLLPKETDFGLLAEIALLLGILSSIATLISTPVLSLSSLCPPPLLCCRLLDHQRRVNYYYGKWGHPANHCWLYSSISGSVQSGNHFSISNRVSIAGDLCPTVVTGHNDGRPVTRLADEGGNRGIGKGKVGGTGAVIFSGLGKATTEGICGVGGEVDSGLLSR